MASKHKCMRCNEEFDCPTPESCTAQYAVLPNIVKGGIVTEHCPLNPDWDWIRAYGKRMFDAGRALLEEKERSK